MTRLLALLLVLLPGPVLALSCPYYDIPTTYRDLRAAPETYVVVYGRFGGNPVRLSQTRRADILRYRFTGKVMTPQGPGPAFDQPVVVTRDRPVPRLDDAGGHVDTDVPVLLFLEKSGETYLIDVSVCRYRQFYEPSARDLREVSNCMQGLWCQGAQY